LDPPYFDTEKYYKNVGEGGFQKEDHIRLRDTLLGIEGKFLLSYNDCEYIRELYDAPGIMIESYNRINNIKQRYDNGAQFPEILIANYDLHERERDGLGQMNLFDINNELNKEENTL
jgi:DNA adenine methylase